MAIKDDIAAQARPKEADVTTVRPMPLTITPPRLNHIRCTLDLATLAGSVLTLTAIPTA